MGPPTREQAAESSIREPLHEPKTNERKGMSVQMRGKLNHHTDEAHGAASEGTASDYIDNGQMDATMWMLSQGSHVDCVHGKKLQ